MRYVISLSGLHRTPRGAEVALESIGRELAADGNEVLLLGSGPSIADRPYRYRRVPAVARERFERWPNLPGLREPSAYESLTFAAGALFRYRPSRADITMSCGFPFDNLMLRRPVLRGRRPAHLFVTQNGDWPALSRSREYRLFACDGLVCTNPVYLERNRDRWPSTLIPNGVDPSMFAPGPPARERFGLPADKPVIMMASALIPSKRVADGIRAVAEIPDAVLVVAGDGPLRDELHELGRATMGDRYVQDTFGHDAMPDLYRSADLLLHPCLAESFGNVYVEALATGLPVVAHRSAITEWILGDHGVLVDTDEQGAMVAAIDRTLRAGRAFGAIERRRRVEERFTWSVVARDYALFAGSILDARS